MGMIRRHHGRQLPGLTVEILLRCFDHEDEEVQQFGAELLRELPDLARLPTATWFTLFKTRNILALETIVALFREHVPPLSLSLSQSVDLAIERSAPVARLGLWLLEQREISSAEDLAAIVRLSHARGGGRREGVADLALKILGDPAHYNVERVIPFFDSLLRETRDGAWSWLGPRSAGYNDSALWSRLLETPYDDARLQLVAVLEQRSRLPGTSTDQLAPLWCGVLLNIHRGGRQKLTALRQISDALIDDPAQAAMLLPVLAVAIRSVRLPETRGGACRDRHGAGSRPADRATRRSIPARAATRRRRWRMNVTLAYRGHSGVADRGAAQTVSLAPNLAREPVAFDAAVAPAAAISRGDLRAARCRHQRSSLQAARQKPRTWRGKKPSRRSEAAIRRRSTPPRSRRKCSPDRPSRCRRDFEQQFDTARKQYWDCPRSSYSNYLYRHDQELWRMLMPCDPVITVADDVVFFECFSGDESSYGCLTVNRGDGFGPSESLQLGTTNVDYSWDLYHHFQSLRSYRQTRFSIDPGGFEVATAGAARLSRGKDRSAARLAARFMQLQSAMTLPGDHAFRCRARRSIRARVAQAAQAQHTSPRAMRFELMPGQAGQDRAGAVGASRSSTRHIYDGPPTEPIRVWGGAAAAGAGAYAAAGRAVRCLPARHRPAAFLGRPHGRDAADARPLRLDGQRLDPRRRPRSARAARDPSPEFITVVADVLRASNAAATASGTRTTHRRRRPRGRRRDPASRSQRATDLRSADAVYRWRQIMPQALGEARDRPAASRVVGLQAILARSKDCPGKRRRCPRGGRIVIAKVDGVPTEVMVDADGRIKAGSVCAAIIGRFGLKNGPCRHMLADSVRSPGERKQRLKQK